MGQSKYAPSRERSRLLSIGRISRVVLQIAMAWSPTASGPILRTVAL